MDEGRESMNEVLEQTVEPPEKDGKSEVRCMHEVGGDITLVDIMHELKMIRMMLVDGRGWRKADVSRDPTSKKAEVNRAHDTTTLDEALELGIQTTGKVKRWFIDKGFGFVQFGHREAFVHASSIRGGEHLQHLQVGG